MSKIQYTIENAPDACNDIEFLELCYGFVKKLGHRT